MFLITITIGLIIGLGDAATLQQRRDAFNPDQLMEHHMDMRTGDQALFGSYHPNDLVQSIVEFFKHSGHDNQWGLFVYNPNQAINQYMGNLNSPGTLGPKLQPGQQQRPTENLGGGDLAQHGERGPAFDPSALNEHLIQSFQNSDYSNFAVPQRGQTQVQGQTRVGFDADTLNQQLMLDVVNNAMVSPTAQPDTATGNPESKEQHTDNKTQNIPSGTESQATAVKDVGFNPDMLNAGLFGSLQYDPNSAKKGIDEMSLYEGSGGIQNVPSAISTSKNNWNAPGVADLTGASSNSLHLYNDNDASQSGSNYMTSVTGTKSGNSETSHNMGDKTGTNNLTFSVPTKPSDAPTKPMDSSFISGNSDASIRETSVGNFVNSGRETNLSPMSETLYQYGVVNGSASSLQEQGVDSGTGASLSGGLAEFKAGGLGNSRTFNQNSRAPPGIPSGGNLHQADNTKLSVHGIGSMG